MHTSDLFIFHKKLSDLGNTAIVITTQLWRFYSESESPMTALMRIADLTQNPIRMSRLRYNNFVIRRIKPQLRWYRNSRRPSFSTPMMGIDGIFVPNILQRVSEDTAKLTFVSLKLIHRWGANPSLDFGIHDRRGDPKHMYRDVNRGITNCKLSAETRDIADRAAAGIDRRIGDRAF